MKHKHITYSLPEFIEGKLAAGEKAAMAEHLRTCDDCKAELKSLERIYGVLSRAETPPPDPYWITLLPRIHRRIAEGRHQSARGWPGWVFRYAVPLASVGLLLFLLFRNISPEPGTVMQGQSSSNGSASSVLDVREVLLGADSVEVQQIEDRSVFLPFEDLAESNNGENRLAGDKDVLKTILTNSNGLYTAIEMDMEATQENLDDQEVTDILSQLSRSKFIN